MMKIVLLLLFFSFSLCRVEASEVPKRATIFELVTKKALYFGAGTAFSALSFFARTAGALCLMTPWSSTIGNEWLLFSHLTLSLASRAFAEIYKGSSLSLCHEVPLSYHSWKLNQMLLSKIPASSDQERELLHFLEKRWLAKSTGFFSTMVDWICPCFGVAVQIHPETSHSYARLPAAHLSQTYQNRVDHWKKMLPHPKKYPLILTRPFDFQKYLPSYLEVAEDETFQTTAKRLSPTATTLDLTLLFENIKEEKAWLKKWKSYRSSLIEACAPYHLDLSQLFCIQRMKQEGIGGIRLLPLDEARSDQLHQHLLSWISTLGLSANRIELDRWPASSLPSEAKESSAIPLQSKEKWSAFFHNSWKSTHPQKAILIDATFQLLNGLLAKISHDEWEKLSSSTTRASVAELSFIKIKEKLERLQEEEKSQSFFETASQIELIHADLSSLLEIFSPFKNEEFPAIYKNLLTSIPEALKPLTSCAIHSSGMTSFGGIFKAVQTMIGKAPRTLYGENSYYECINTAERIADASPTQEASEKEWKEVDLILAQFNPVIKRTHTRVIRHHAEKVAEMIRLALKEREGKPLTVALDCTIDYIDSPRVAKLLEEFQNEILEGSLNIIGYRSGLKFDLFGMDNYCGAPLFMIHNQERKWSHFEMLLTDPALQTDRLSMNWFSLAYQNAAPQLEFYRKQIFDNTRALLNQLPSQLFSENSGYRIVPVDADADPVFIDMKVSVPLHSIRGAMLAAGCLYLRCMEGNHPIFYRPSIGFYHPNYTLIFDKPYTTIRLTLGLDPSQIDLLRDSFQIIHSLNGAPWKASLENLLEKLPVIKQSL